MMNDYEVTKFTEQRFKKHSLVDIKILLKKKINQKLSFYMGFLLNIIHYINI